MLTLVVGASGATGRLLVEQLLQEGQPVRAVVRSADRLPEALRKDDRLTVIEAGIPDASDEEIAGLVDGCGAIASCLGHNLTFQGLFGHPRNLVTDVTRRLCEAARNGSPAAPVRFVLMNTAGNSNRDLREPVSLAQRGIIPAGNSNRDLREPVSLAQRGIIQLLRFGLPPHRDNEMASDYLRTRIGQNHPSVEWAVVRPDTLTSEANVTPYELHPSPTRSALFNPGKTSRINTARFMAELILDDDLWARWSGRMPVIYNAE